MWWLWQLLRIVERLEAWEWVEESEFRRDDVADDFRRLFECLWKRAAIRGGGANAWPSPASSEWSMSGSSGISSLPSSSCELASSISESLKDMLICKVSSGSGVAQMCRVSPERQSLLVLTEM